MAGIVCVYVGNEATLCCLQYSFYLYNNNVYADTKTSLENCVLDETEKFNKNSKFLFQKVNMN